MMKILMIAPEPFFEPRGTPFSIMYRIRAFSKLGNETDLVTYHIGKDIRIKGLKIYRIPDIPFIKKVKIGPSFAKFILDPILFWKAYLMAKRGDYDLVHVHEEAAIIGVIIKKIFKIPLLYDMHSSMPEQIDNYHFTNIKTLRQSIKEILRVIENLVLKNSDLVITICPELQKIAGKNSSGKSMLIENTAQIDEKPADKKKVKKLKKRLGLQGKKVILYTGTLEYNQGIGMLISSMQHLSDLNQKIILLIVGGKDEQVRHFKELAKGLNLDKQIRFMGQVKRDDIPFYNLLADVLVSPRLIGINTPLKIYSYLRTKKPIVATRIRSHEQVLDDTCAILVDPEPASFAEGIRKALADKKRSANLAKNAMKLSRMRYSVKEYERKTKMLLENLG